MDEIADDGALTLDVRCSVRTASRCGGRSRTDCSRISAPAVIRPAAGCRPRPNCRSSSASIATPCAARWRNCRAAAWCASSRAAARSSPRTCWTTRSSRARGSPNGSAGTTRSRRAACCSCRRSPPIRTSPAASASAPGSRVVLLERLGFADERPVSLSQHYFPPPACAACSTRCAHRRRITEALQAVGVDGLSAPGHPRHRAAAERRGGGAAAHARATGRCWSPRTSTSIAPARWWNSAIGCYPTPRVQIVFEP